jgi:hypothetical protein
VTIVIAPLRDPDSGEPHLTGTVADAAFRGRGHEHAVDIPEHGRLTGMFAVRRADRAAGPGSAWTRPAATCSRPAPPRRPPATAAAGQPSGQTRTP